MTSTLMLPIVRWSIGFLIGAFAAYRLRSALRVSIAYFFPMSKRMLPNFFGRLRRYTAIASILLTILIAVSLNLLFLHFTKKAASNPKELQSTQSFDLLEDLPAPKISKEMPFSDSDTVVHTIVAPVSTPPPPTVVDKPFSASIPSDRTYYLQLGAFQDYQNALRLKNRWTTQTAYTVLLVTFPDASPHKVILGPFAHLDAARHFQDRHQLNAFPRAASYYHSIQF